MSRHKENQGAGKLTRSDQFDREKARYKGLISDYLRDSEKKAAAAEKKKAKTQERKKDDESLDSEDEGGKRQSKSLMKQKRLGLHHWICPSYLHHTRFC